MNVSGILQSNLSCDLEKSYSFVDKWEAHHYPEDICLFQLPSNLRTGCGASDDGFRILGCKSVYTQIEQVIYSLVLVYTRPSIHPRKNGARGKIFET